ncbi:MAG: molybdate ABC transporter substrate-binding protein [Chloroflexi bacterium]|nr:molybdate ABC transporter substrate-binding protein [Chloroflexota bacterium]
MKFLVRPVFGLVILLLAVCGLSAGRARQTLVVFAASSLADAFEELGTAFTVENPNIDVVFNFGGSSALAAQLVEGGAPADVFASANVKQMEVAVAGGRIDSDPVTFARNRLVLIVPAENPAQIESLRDLATPGVKLVVAAPNVPVREYTETMLQKLADDPAYNNAYRDAVRANIVSEEDNVRQVAAKVALGEADAGIVYASDVTPDIAGTVLALPIPDEVNTIAEYPIAITSDSANPELARAFVDFVLSDAGQAILTKWGFVHRCDLAPEATPEAEATPETTPDANGC